MDKFDHEMSLANSSDNNFIQLDFVYNISYEKQNSINYLADYSDFFQKKKITDSRMMQYFKISKTNGKDVESDTELASLHLDHFGNFLEDDPLLLKNLTENTLIGKTRVRDANLPPLEENPSKNRKKGKGGLQRKSKKIDSSDKLNLTAFTRNELEMPTIDDNLREKSLDGFNHNMPLPKDNKTFDTTTTSIMAGSFSNTNFNDEAFNKIIKEFLNINAFPDEAKEKLCLIKKFISVYKKIKDDKAKLNNFLKRISEKLKEPYDEIRDMFEFEYLRNKREGTFSNLSKLINKLVNSLKELNIFDIASGLNILEHDEIKEKRNAVISKVNEYMSACKEIQSFFLRGDYINQTIEKFIPSFKLSKFSGSEGRDKILKKLKECLEKNNITYFENSLADIIFPILGDFDNDFDNSHNGDDFFDNKNPLDFYSRINGANNSMSKDDVDKESQLGGRFHINLDLAQPSNENNVTVPIPAAKPVDNSLTFLQFVSKLNSNSSEPHFGKLYYVKQYNKIDFQEFELKHDEHSEK